MLKEKLFEAALGSEQQQEATQVNNIHLQGLLTERAKK